MKDKIAKIIWFNKNEVKAAEEILNLPVDGVQVTFTCPECDGKKEYIHNGFTDDFDSNGQPVVDEELKGKLVPCDCVDGKMVRHLTIGEALEILPRMVTGLKSMSNGDAFLTTIDGGKIERGDNGFMVCNLS